MNKKIGFLIIGGGLLLMLLIIYFIFFYNFDKTQEPEVKITAPAQIIETSNIKEDKIVKQIDTTIPASKEILPEELEKIASSFAERFGSYSNQADSGNLVDLKLVMTNKMQTWADTSIAEALAKTDKNTYFGVTTKALSAKIISGDVKAAHVQVLVKTKRQEESDKAEQAKTYYQDLKVDLIKTGSDWKIDTAYWQK